MADIPALEEKRLPTKAIVTERQLQALVERSLGRIEEGLTYIDHYITCGSGTIDILCLDKKDNPVVIELKVDEDADQDALVQGMDYASWVEKNPDTLMRFANEKNPDLLKGRRLGEVRIILVTPHFGPRTINAAGMVEPNISLLRYICLEHPSFGQYLHFETDYDSRTDRGAPPVPHDYKIEDHFVGDRAKLRPLFDSLLEKLEKEFGELSAYAKKYYLALQSSNIFAVVQVKSKMIEVGVGLEGPETSERLHDAANWGWSWVTHFFRIRSVEDIDDEVIRWIRESYNSRS